MKKKQNNTATNSPNLALILALNILLTFSVFSMHKVAFAYNPPNSNNCQKELIINISLPKQPSLFEIFKSDFCFQGTNYKFNLELLPPGLYQSQTRNNLQNNSLPNIDVIVVEPYLFDEIDVQKIHTQVFDNTWFKKLDSKITSSIIAKNNNFYLLPFLIDLPIIVSKTKKPETGWLDILDIMKNDIENPQYFFVVPIAKGVIATKALQMFANAFGGSFYDEFGFANYNSFDSAIKQIFNLIDYSWIHQKTAIADDLISGMINDRFQNIMVFSKDLFEYNIINNNMAYNQSKNLQLKYPNNWFFAQAPYYNKKSISMFEVWSLALVANNNKINQNTLIELIKQRQNIIEKVGLVVYKKNNSKSQLNSLLLKSFKTASKPIRYANFRNLVRKEIGLVLEDVIDRKKDPFNIINLLQIAVNQHLKNIN